MTHLHQLGGLRVDGFSIAKNARLRVETTRALDL